MLTFGDFCVEWSQEKLQNLHVKLEKLAFILAIIAYEMFFFFFFAICIIYSFVI